MCLNYAVFLYNAGDRSAAGRQFHNFEKRLTAAASSDVDPEVTKLLRFLQIVIPGLLPTGEGVYSLHVTNGERQGQLVRAVLHHL